ncbi:MAG: phosphatidylglycerophosphatase A [Porticoccus sp.]|jgi:phosphatidylglycerophosphatase A|nr:phosphatidylglycerophosphatase A [Porticoccus sp.]
MRSLNPNFRQLLQNPIHLLAFGFGAGLFVKAPGTVGTLLGILVWVFLAKLAIASYIIVLVIVTLFGVYICGKTAKDLKAHDHSGIVWDEIVGIWLAMIMIPVSWGWILASFLLFRFLDILKPWPISWLDKNVSGGIGIMADDLLAGAFTSTILFLAAKII